jgi:hypothetical protein
MGNLEGNGIIDGVSNLVIVDFWRSARIRWNLHGFAINFRMFLEDFD